MALPCRVFVSKEGCNGNEKDFIAFHMCVCYNIKDCGQEDNPETTEKNISCS